MRPGGDPILRFADFALDASRPELRRHGAVVALRPKSLALISHLAQRPGQLVRKQELVEAVWEGTAVTDATLSRTLFEARAALGDDSRRPRFIATIHRLGFRFIAALDASAGAPAAAAALVGRLPELARLRTLRQRAAAGTRQIVFLPGEAGIGKTSVLDALLADADASGALVGRGQCIEHYGAAEAYLPLLDAIGALCRGATAATVVPVLRRVAPTWLAQFPWLVEEQDRAALERELRGVARERMLREAAQALETLAEAHLVILALEDLHWADCASADLLAFLARRTSPARLLVVATYRPVDAILSDHPIRPVHHELTRQKRCQTLPIDALAPADVTALIERRFAAAPFAAELAAVLHRRTDGNPLFLLSMLDDLVAQGRIAVHADGWRFRGSVGEVAERMPEDVLAMVRVQHERLAAEEREVVDAASVAGVSFSAAEAAAALQCDVVAVEERCEALAQAGMFLDRAAAGRWPDGTSASGYTFRHALYRDALYRAVPAARRRLLHERIGVRLAAAYGADASAAALLGMHFDAAGDHGRAAHHLRQAAEVAARRGAPREALALTDRARAHLTHLPQGFERTLEELLVEIAAGPALAATTGYAAPEVERIFIRARELCRRLGDGAQLFPILWGLWAFWAVRGRMTAALDLARQCLALAEQSGDRALLLEAHHALWVTQFFRGDVGAASRHLDAGLPLHDRGQHHAHVMLFGQDPGVVGLAYRSLVLLAQGRARDALAQSQAAIDLGRALGHPVSLIFGLHFGAWLHEQRGDWARCRELAGEVGTIAAAHALPFWHAHATWFAARALAHDDPHGSVAGMRAGLDALAATGAAMGVPAYLTTLARTHLDLGQLADARRLIDEAGAIADDCGEELTRTEMLRLRGDLELAALRADPPRRWPRGGAAACAESLFRQAVDLARAQQAAGLELRAALALAELWSRQGRRAKVRALLAPLLDRLPADDDVPERRAAQSLLVG